MTVGPDDVFSRWRRENVWKRESFCSGCSTDFNFKMRGKEREKTKKIRYNEKHLEVRKC